MSSKNYLKSKPVTDPLEKILEMENYATYTNSQSSSLFIDKNRIQLNLQILLLALSMKEFLSFHYF